MKTSKTTLQVLILDDDANLETAIQSKLPKRLAKTSKTVQPRSIVPLVKQLGERMAAARKSGKIAVKKNELDDTDVFIVDYDLLDAKKEDYLTGETVAYLARCYSSCGLIIALNQFWRQPTFDLSLKPSLESFADLNLPADDLEELGLWESGPWKTYRPWSWPIVPNLVALMRKRVKDVKSARIDTRVVEFLGFPQSAIERLPTASLGLLGGSQSRAESATLKDILGSPELGLRGKEASERKRLPDQDSRIIAARLTAWLNLILSPQDVLVDAPHLAERCPSLLGTNPTQKSFAVTLQHDPKLPIFNDSKLKKAKLDKDLWFDRPVWFWTEIERQRLTKEIRAPWETGQSRFVFCEDTSSFEPRSSAKSFQSDLSSPYRTRYVKQLRGVDYQPAHRLAIS